MPYYDLSPKGDILLFEDTQSIVINDLIIHFVRKYQLHQQKGVCYRQIATHPMTACLGQANVLRKQELKRC